MAGRPAAPLVLRKRGLGQSAVRLYCPTRFQKTGSPVANAPCPPWTLRARSFCRWIWLQDSWRQYYTCPRPVSMLTAQQQRLPQPAAAPCPSFPQRPRDWRPSVGTALGSKGLSAEAPAFQPYAPFYSDFSAEAPAFVPSWNPGLPKVVEEATEVRQRAPGKLAFGSDTSTEVGDSEDDEKNSPARVKCSLSKPIGPMGARARSGSAGSV